MNRGDHDIRPEARPVLAKTPPLLFETAVPPGDDELLFALARLDFFGRIEDREVFSDDFFGRVPLDALGAEVPRRNAPLRIQHENAVVEDALDEEPHALLALDQRKRANGRDIAVGTCIRQGARLGLRSVRLRHAVPYLAAPRKSWITPSSLRKKADRNQSDRDLSR